MSSVSSSTAPATRRKSQPAVGRALQLIAQRAHLLVVRAPDHLVRADDLLALAHDVLVGADVPTGAPRGCARCRRGRVRCSDGRSCPAASGRARRRPRRSRSDAPGARASSRPAKFITLSAGTVRSSVPRRRMISPRTLSSAPAGATPWLSQRPKTVSHGIGHGAPARLAGHVGGLLRGEAHPSRRRPPAGCAARSPSLRALPPLRSRTLREEAADVGTRGVHGRRQVEEAGHGRTRRLVAFPRQLHLALRHAELERGDHVVRRYGAHLEHREVHRRRGRKEQEGDQRERQRDADAAPVQGERTRRRGAAVCRPRTGPATIAWWLSPPRLRRTRG